LIDKNGVSNLAASSIAVPLESAHNRSPAQFRGIKIAASRFYRPELDVLRFCAFLAVFFHHALPGFELDHHVGNAVVFLRLETSVKEAGGFGVCLFFLLSAYLITELSKGSARLRGESMSDRFIYAECCAYGRCIFHS
jgi:peptidoglycan/LPS O-acetylase OafA/YrhL